MYCRKCGKEMNESDKFCSSCGSSSIPDVSNDLDTSATSSPRSEQPFERNSYSILLLAMIAVYIGAFAVMVFQLFAFANSISNTEWWKGDSSSRGLTVLDEIRYLYALEVIVLVFCFIGIAQKKLLSWWYVLISCILNMIWQISILSIISLLAAFGGGIMYAMMGLEVIICFLLVVEYPFFLEKYKERKQKKEEKEEKSMISNCDTVFCPKCSNEYSAKYTGNRLENAYEICPGCGYKMTREEFASISS